MLSADCMGNKSIIKTPHKTTYVTGHVIRSLRFSPRLLQRRSLGTRLRCSRKSLIQTCLNQEVFRQLISETILQWNPALRTLQKSNHPRYCEHFVWCGCICCVQSNPLGIILTLPLILLTFLNLEWHWKGPKVCPCLAHSRLLCQGGGKRAGTHCSHMCQVPMVTCMLLRYTKITDNSVYLL